MSDEFTRRYFQFSIGEHLCIADSAYHLEYFPKIDISQLPNAPSACLGLCAVRGNILPAFSAHKYFQQTPSAGTGILVFGEEQDAVALRVDTKPRPLTEVPRRIRDSAPGTPPKWRGQNGIVLHELVPSDFFGFLTEADTPQVNA